jgi:hypothetical protein
VLVWIADDPAEDDGDRAADTNGILLVRAEAIGENGSRRSIEAAVRRAGIDDPTTSGYTGQKGHDERGQRRRSGAVGTEGEALDRVQMDIGAGGFAP